MRTAIFIYLQQYLDTETIGAFIFIHATEISAIEAVFTLFLDGYRKYTVKFFYFTFIKFYSFTIVLKGDLG